jgi:DNA-binding transcriptional regulator YdaS (Cro superfamily)
MQTASVSQVIDALGGLTKAAAALEIENPSVIANWRTRGRVPFNRAIQIEAITGISRHKLRPDIFGPTPENVS